MSREVHGIDTPLGRIEAHIGVDEDYPGIWVNVNGRGMVLVEYDATEEKHVVRVWSSEDEDADYIFKHDIVEEGDSEDE